MAEISSFEEKLEGIKLLISESQKNKLKSKNQTFLFGEINIEESKKTKSNYFLRYRKNKTKEVSPNQLELDIKSGRDSFLMIKKNLSEINKRNSFLKETENSNQYNINNEAASKKLKSINSIISSLKF